jgi:hypothetical protein
MLFIILLQLPEQGNSRGMRGFLLDLHIPLQQIGNFTYYGRAAFRRRARLRGKDEPGQPDVRACGDANGVAVMQLSNVSDQVHFTAP